MSLTADWCILCIEEKIKSGGYVMYQAGTEEWEKKYAELIEERKKSESEPYIVGTPEWASEFEKKNTGR